MRRMLTTSMVSLCLFALALGPSALAQEMPPETEPPPEEMPDMEPAPEAEFPGLEEPHPLVVLHAINQIQSQLGLMGVNEAQRTELRELANDMAEAYNALDRSMLETANDLDIDVAGSGEVRMAMEMRLQNLDPQLHMLMEAPPQAFDAAFIDLVVRSHEDAIQTVQELRGEAENAQVRGHITESLQQYQGNLQRAQQLQAQLETSPEQEAEPEGEADE